MQETMMILERETELEKEMVHENSLENVKPEKEMASGKNDMTKDLMARELSEMGLTPQAINRLLNLKN